MNQLGTAVPAIALPLLFSEYDELSGGKVATVTCNGTVEQLLQSISWEMLALLVARVLFATYVSA